MVSLTKKAEKKPDTPTIPQSSQRGRWACSTTQAAATVKKPDRRRFATTIIMPNSSMMVS